jgi:hypothetical protein
VNIPFLDVTLQDWYYLSKAMAEREAFAYAAKTELDAVTICPSLVIGPLMQSTVNSSSKILLNYFKGRVVMCWFSFIFVYAWLEIFKIKTSLRLEFCCYRVSGVPNLCFPLISVINFYYVINKLIILAPDPHYFGTDPPLKVYLNSYLPIFNH